MAGHGLLPGCHQPWRHDECSGFEPGPSAPEGETSYGGVVCNCPCHGLKKRLLDVGSEVEVTFVGGETTFTNEGIHFSGRVKGLALQRNGRTYILLTGIDDAG
jgi:hypothetical protein